MYSVGMSFINYLGATLRFVDLIDSRRPIGSKHPMDANEDRPGHSKGYWLDLAIFMLEFLREREVVYNGSHVHIDDIKEYISKRHPEVTHDDVLYVASILSSPTLFEYMDPTDQSPIPRATKETALLERSKAKTGYRLSKQGREALAMSDGFQAIIYAEQDAYKICVAIERHRFDDALRFCHEISVRIRGYALEITRSLERPDREATLRDFMEHHEAYIDIMVNVQNAVQEARYKLSTEPVIEAFNMTFGEDSDANRMILVGTTTKLTQSVERLGRKMTDLVIAVHSREASGATVQGFDKIAMHFALSLKGKVATHHILEMIGPWRCSVQYMAVSDTGKYFKDDIIPIEKAELSFTTKIEAMPEALSDLFRKHLAEISARLSEGPLSLTEAMESGWLYLDDGCKGLFALLGVYNCPDELGFDGSVIHVCRSNHKFSRDFGSGYQIHGEDILLVVGSSEE